MKSTRSYRLFSFVRMTTAIALGSAAVAMAFVAVKGPTQPIASAHQDRTSKFRQDRDELLRNKLALPGDRDFGPLNAAIEDFAHRAYPLDDVPTEASLNAISGFNHFVAATAGVGNGKNTPGAWHLVGPSNAVDPNILTFSGAQYVTSGRITALAISPACSINGCRAWAGAAGGGVWRTDNALSGSGANWTFVSGSFGTNAIGSLLLDPNDSTHNTIYAATGEPNASGDSEAGVGVYKSTDGGNTWALVPGTDIFFQRSIGQMAIDNSGTATNGTLLVPIASGVRGVSSVTGGSSSSAATGHPLATRGLYRCNGTTCTLIRAIVAVATARGSTTVKVDPTHAGVIYVNEFSEGVWRSVDNGATWTQIKTPLNGTLSTDRAEFAVTAITGGFTRMYVGVGNSSVTAANQARLYRTDDAVTATNASFTDLTAAQQGSGAPNQTLNYCGDPAAGAQCWYDNVVYSPPGKPDVVYLGGSFNYSRYGSRNNGRAFIRSTDAGANFTDLSWDATTNPTPAGSCCQPNSIAPNGMHPDQHAIVEIPGTNAAIFGSDGGLTRSSGAFADISSQCGSRIDPFTGLPLAGTTLATCQQLLSAVPTYLYNLNKGLSTIQFQSVSVAADNSKHVQGGNQDNGTFETYGSNVTWPQIIYGDGGQSGFSVTNSAMRFNSFSGQFHDGNFQNGDPSKWVIISGPIASSPEGSNFYPPLIADPNPANAGTIFEGSLSVWRTQDWGGSQALLEANCPEFTTNGATPTCGDFVRLGATGLTDLTGTAYGTDRLGGNALGSFVAAIQRTPSNTGTVWAATNAGRVFISDNAGDAAAASVVWNRLDPSSTVDPNRFISSIYVDPANANHAWISYSGYNVNTPTLPGHVFEVTRTPATSTATWTDISYNLPDFPITSVVLDNITGDLYAASDFGVMRLPSGTTTWTTTSGLPMVEVAGLTIVPNSRILYAATHGRSAWSLALP
jgi:hypothetical protein